MSNFATSAPFNNLSFGNVAVAISREFYKRGLYPSIFPIGGGVDISSQVGDEGFNRWLSNGINNAQKYHSRDNPTLKLWHVGGSLESPSKKTHLLTFYECNDPTPTEVNILKNQDKVYLTNQYSVDIIRSHGVNAELAPLGFDSHNFRQLEKRPVIDGVMTTLLLGKAENRKNTFRQLSLWSKRYGNRREYRLNVAIANSFLKPEHLDALINQALEGKKYWNINFLPFMATNAEYNSYLQSGQIVLAASSAEGFGLGEYHATALGAWPVALNAHAFKDHFNNSNACLIQPNGMVPLYDGIFFAPNQAFNQGSGFTFSDDDWYAAHELAEKRAAAGINTEGLKLQQQTYAQTVDILLKSL